MLTQLLACSRSPTPELRTESRRTARGTLYTVLQPQGLAIRVVATRPAENSSCQLSVAAAYTDLDTSQPLDLLVCKGSRLQLQPTVGFLDGLLTIIGDSLAITRVAPGQPLSAVRLKQASRLGGTMLLQELLVWQGRNQKPAGGTLFQRRALAEFAGQHFAVIESTSDSLTMQQFAADLIELGAQNALYLDMGDWDEGWYKHSGKVIRLGHRRTATSRQSNWLVFDAPTPLQH